MTLQRIIGSPKYIFIFLATLMLPQLVGFGKQFERGFRPFTQEPQRVALSWDMFAIRIERCVLEWQPALPMSPVGPLSSLRQLSSALEWDVIYDRMVDYRAVALWGCDSTKESTRVKLRCFLPEGNEVQNDFDCP